MLQLEALEVEVRTLVINPVPQETLQARHQAKEMLVHQDNNHLLETLEEVVELERLGTPMVLVMVETDHLVQLQDQQLQELVVAVEQQEWTEPQDLVEMVVEVLEVVILHMLILLLQLQTLVVVAVEDLVQEVDLKDKMVEQEEKELLY